MTAPGGLRSLPRLWCMTPAVLSFADGRLFWKPILEHKRHFEKTRLRASAIENDSVPRCRDLVESLVHRYVLQNRRQMRQSRHRSRYRQIHRLKGHCDVKPTHRRSYFITPFYRPNRRIGVVLVHGTKPDFSYPCRQNLPRRSPYDNSYNTGFLIRDCGTFLSAKNVANGGKANLPFWRGPQVDLGKRRLKCGRWLTKARIIDPTHFSGRPKLGPEILKHLPLAIAALVR